MERMGGIDSFLMGWVGLTFVMYLSIQLGLGYLSDKLELRFGLG